MLIPAVLASSAIVPARLRNVVFVDPAVEAPEVLLNGLVEETEVHLLSLEQDAVEQITTVLAARQGTGKVHIVAHGSPGCLRLGKGELSLSTLEQYVEQLQAWFALGDSASLLLHSCNVAVGDAGAEFIEKLHRITGAGIAASTTLIGNAELGGNWELDARLGQVDAESPFTAEAMASFKGVLETFTVDKLEDEVDSNGQALEGSLRRAIEDANAAGVAEENHIIKFEIDPSKFPDGSEFNRPYPIFLGSSLPPIEVPVTIGELPKDAEGNLTTAAPLVVLDGTNAGQDVVGLTLTKEAGGDPDDSDDLGSSIFGIGIRNFSDDGLRLEGKRNIIQGNLIENNKGSGILIDDQEPQEFSGQNNNIPGPILPTENQIGGQELGQGNILKNNGNLSNELGEFQADSDSSQIRVEAGTGNTFSGNSILSTDASNESERIIISSTNGQEQRTDNEAGIDLPNPSNTGINTLREEPPTLDRVEENRIIGTFTGNPNQTYIIEYFANTVQTAEDGEVFLGSHEIKTDENGDLGIEGSEKVRINPQSDEDIQLFFDFQPVEGKNFFTATATNKETGETSSFGVLDRLNRSPVIKLLEIQKDGVTVQKSEGDIDLTTLSTLLVTEGETLTLIGTVEDPDTIDIANLALDIPSPSLEGVPPSSQLPFVNITETRRVSANELTWTWSGVLSDYLDDDKDFTQPGVEPTAVPLSIGVTDNRGAVDRLNLNVITQDLRPEATRDPDPATNNGISFYETDENVPFTTPDISANDKWLENIPGFDDDVRVFAISKNQREAPPEFVQGVNGDFSYQLIGQGTVVYSASARRFTYTHTTDLEEGQTNDVIIPYVIRDDDGSEAGAQIEIRVTGVDGPPAEKPLINILPAPAAPLPPQTNPPQQPEAPRPPVPQDLLGGAPFEGESVFLNLIEGRSDTTDEIILIPTSSLDGGINGLFPDQEGYTDAQLRNARPLFSALAAGTFPELGEPGRRLALNPDSAFQIGIIKKGTLESLRRGTGGTLQLATFADGSNVVTGQQLLDDQPVLNLQVPGQGRASAFVLATEPAVSNAVMPLGGKLQGTADETELLDFRDEVGNKIATFEVFREADFDSLVGFYQIENQQGQVRDALTGALLSPGEEGYTAAAIANRLDNVNLSSQNGVNITYQTEIEMGTLLAPFIVVNDGLENLLDISEQNDPTVYFAYGAANRDGQDHVRLLRNNIFGFEDLAGGGDFDFNDLIVKMSFQ